MNAQNLISFIEDLYTARFLKDTSYFKAQLKKGADEISEKPFPSFIYEYLKKKYKNNKMTVLQNALDLVNSVEFHKESLVEAILFGRFLSRQYDTRDLVFFLYTR
jgi:ligand-binding SRPBCC domain-containing protein